MADRQRNVLRESNTEALLGGIFSLLSGLLLLAAGFVFSVIPVKPCLGAVVIIGSSIVAVPRMTTNAVHGTIGKYLVKLGAGLGVLGALAVLVRVAP